MSTQNSKCRTVIPCRGKRRPPFRPSPELALPSPKVASIPINAAANLASSSSGRDESVVGPGVGVDVGGAVGERVGPRVGERVGAFVGPGVGADKDEDKKRDGGMVQHYGLWATR